MRKYLLGAAVGAFATLAAIVANGVRGQLRDQASAAEE